MIFCPSWALNWNKSIVIVLQKYMGRVVLWTWAELSYKLGQSCLGQSFMWAELSVIRWIVPFSPLPHPPTVPCHYFTRCKIVHRCRFHNHNARKKSENEWQNYYYKYHILYSFSVTIYTECKEKQTKPK